mgnify:CR=1 FL=1
MTTATSPFAAGVEATRRERAEVDHPLRNAFQRDRDRIIHLSLIHI